MRINGEYAERLIRENQRLAKEVKQNRADIEFLKKCLYMALSKRNAIVLGKEFESLENPRFEFDENLSGEALLRVAGERNGKQC